MEYYRQNVVQLLLSQIRRQRKLSVEFLCFMFLVFFKIYRLQCMFKRCPPNTRCILVNNTAVCSCPKSCDRRYSPVCGNNWKTYNNYCQLVEQSCKDKSRRLRLLYYGTCKSCCNDDASFYM